MSLLYLNISKVDQEQRIVEGIASTEALDNQPGEWDGHKYAGDIVDADAIRAALPDYLKWSNIREMHQASAVGTALSAEVIDGKLHLAIKVVDDGAWDKVKQGVYKGFSIGGRIVKAMLEKLADGTYIRRILELVLTEISLVDRPANPDARILLYKMEDAPMPKDDDKQTQDAAPALDAETIAAIKKLAGQTLEKASTDPAKIVAMIQASRNELELAGDMDGAALMTQAIALIQQATGEADTPAEEDTTTPTEEPPPDEAAMLAQRAKTGTLRKAGAAVSAARMASLEQTVKTLLQMMAGAGSAKAQKAIAAMADGDETTMAAAIGAELTKAVTPLASAILNVNERLLKIEQLPAPGGPVLRQVEKALAGQKPPSTSEKPALTPLIKAQLDNLQRLANTDPNAALRADYQKRYEALRAEYQ